MSESKQEARLPTRLSPELEKTFGDTLRHEGACERGESKCTEYPCPINEKHRLAILAALDEARDEALERAAAVFDDENAAARFHEVYQNEAHRRGDVRHPDDYEELP